MEGEHRMEDPLIVAAIEAVTELHLEHQDTRRVLHGTRLSLFLAEQVKVLGDLAKAQTEEVVVGRLAGLFYPLGIRINSTGHLEASQIEAKAFLLTQKASPERIDKVERCLAETFSKRPESLAANLLADALIGTYANTEVNNWADLRQLEQTLLDGRIDRVQGAQLQLQELLSIRYATATGQQHWQAVIAEQLMEQKKRVEKLIRDQRPVTSSVNTSEDTFVLENGVPVRAAQTYFRAVYRNHINLSAIADNKANIMISVNSILISVLITFLSYRNIAETQPMILLPVVIFLVTGLASLIFAVLSARPKVTNLKNTASEKNRGLAFFGNFVQLSLPDFSAAMDEQLQSSHLLYGSMVEDLYHLGQVLDKKYRSLSISYNIFMLGLIVTVVLFLITLFAN